MKSKVLSVRLSLEALQSCFDLCEALGTPTNGASGAIARCVELLTSDLRAKGSIPTYKPHELALLVTQFIGKKNPTSMASLSSLSGEHCSARPTTPISSGNDLSPKMFFSSGEAPKVDRETVLRDMAIEEEELSDLIEEQIRSVQREEESDLLSKIMMIGG